MLPPVGNGLIMPSGANPPQKPGSRHATSTTARGACMPVASMSLAIVSIRVHDGAMASLKVGNLGEFLREQRRSARLSLRQLSEAAGVSNPYLSQIERGLRKPSAEILQQLAKALRISAETLYVQAGILDERDRDEVEVKSAIMTDPSINERQKQVLIQIYESFRRENGHTADADAPDGTPAAPPSGPPSGSGSRAGADDDGDSGEAKQSS